jgi:glucose/arabinose dehydrogenase
MAQCYPSVLAGANVIISVWHKMGEPSACRLWRNRLRSHVLFAALALLTAAPASADVAVPSGFRNAIFAGGLTLPSSMAFAPDGRIFVCEQGGAVRVIKQGALLSSPFVTLSVDATGERGLLGIVFDPDFPSNHFVYLYYTTTTTPKRNRVSRFTAAGDVASPGSEVVIFELTPLSGATNHNGGALAFGPDGELYVAVGENATGSNAQTLSNLLGKILRINANGSIPTDNPFFMLATGTNRAIWALGLRNPFTFAFQPGSGQMFINDVGQNTYEEIDEGFAGANYGWPLSEGPTSQPGQTGPIYYYQHDSTAPSPVCAITGGTFYNPSPLVFPAEFEGDYFFADFCAGFVERRDSVSGVVSAFATGISFPVDLDIGPDGQLYYLSRGGGYVGRISYATPQLTSFTPSSAPPFALGQTITWTAHLAPGGPAAEYRFWLYSTNSGNWTSTTYGPSNIFVFSPGQVGTYALQVWARTVGSAAERESYLATGYIAVIPAPVSITGLSPNQQTPGAAGAPLMWTATATGGSGALSYKYWIFSAAGGSWALGRDYDVSPSWTWTPAQPGTYALQVWARSAGSPADYDGWHDTGFFTIANPVPATPNLSRMPSGSLRTGVPVTWSASTSGGRLPTQYKFWLFSQKSGMWQVTRDWGAGGTWSWLPREAGTYAVQAWVRSAGSNSNWDAWTSSGFFNVLPSPLTLAAPVPDRQLPVAPGTAVTWEATATGGIPPLSYQFWTSTAGVWSLLRDYAPQATVTWTIDDGTHAIEARVKQSGSSAAFDVRAATSPFTVQAVAPNVVSFVSNETFPVPVGTPIVWTAEAVRGLAPLEFQFWRWDHGVWQVVQAWSAERTWQWTPALADAGTHYLQVWVRSAGGSGYEAWAPFGPFDIVP